MKVEWWKEMESDEGRVSSPIQDEYVSHVPGGNITR